MDTPWTYAWGRAARAWPAPSLLEQLLEGLTRRPVGLREWQNGRAASSDIEAAEWQLLAGSTDILGEGREVVRCHRDLQEQNPAVTALGRRQIAAVSHEREAKVALASGENIDWRSIHKAASLRKAIPTKKLTRAAKGSGSGASELTTRAERHTRHKSAEMVAGYIREADKWTRSGLKGVGF